MIAHQWRYLVLSAALIAAVSLLLLSSNTGKIAAQPAVANSDEQILIGMVRQVAEGIPRQIYRGGPSPNPYLDLKNFVGDPGENMGRKFDGLVRQNLTVIRVDVDDFHVKINGAEATVGFLGTIYFKDPVRGEENSLVDRYVVEMVKAKGQWRALPSPPPPPPPPPRPVDGVKNDDPPPPPPPPPDPWYLVVKIPQGGGNYNLNAIEVPSLEELGQKLNNALNGRPADKKTVVVKAPETIADEEVVKVFNVITAAGGLPIKSTK